MADHVLVKASLKYEEHHVFPLTTQSLANLKENVSRNFPLLQRPNILFKLFWRDKEGDRICLLTDDDLRIALKAAKDGNFPLHFDIVVDVVPLPDLPPVESLRVRSDLESSHNVCGPPIETCTSYSSGLDARPVEVISRSTYERSMSRSPLSYEGGWIPESRPQQPMLDVPHEGDVLDLTPNDEILTPMISGWPTESTYSLGSISKMKKTLDENKDECYSNDAGKKCRVLCILNKKCKEKEVYRGNGMDMEKTFLQQTAKRKWDLQIYKDKTKQEIEDCLNEEMKRDFSCNSSLIVIIISGGFTSDSRSFICGTDGSTIDYTLIRDRFEEVSSLKGKPKVFIMDDMKFFKDQNDISLDPPEITTQKQLITVPTPSGLIDQRDCEAVPINKEDTFVCLASTLGRSDKLVKGSWVIGALISILCKEGSRLSFQEMMKQVQLMITFADLPVDSKVPDPVMMTEDHLKKPFYLLPPPS